MLIYCELEHEGHEYRVEWNQGATVNIQCPIGGQWVDTDCVTSYSLETMNDAVELVLQRFRELDAYMDSEAQEEEEEINYKRVFELLEEIEEDRWHDLKRASTLYPEGDEVRRRYLSCWAELHNAIKQAKAQEEEERTQC